MNTRLEIPWKLVYQMFLSKGHPESNVRGHPPKWALPLQHRRVQRVQVPTGTGGYMAGWNCNRTCHCVAFRGLERQALPTTQSVGNLFMKLSGCLPNSENNHLEQDPPVLDGVKPGKEGLLRPGSNTGGMPWSAGYVVGRLRAWRGALSNIPCC